MKRRKVNADEVAAALEELPEWEIKDGKLHKTFRFKTFSEALGWMVSVGVEADKLDHHPDWCNGYNKVKVELITHDLGALSTFDLELARRMEKLR